MRGRGPWHQVWHVCHALGGLWLVVVLAASPAEAHKLRIFATAEGRVIAGYGFFVGGGRTQGVTVVLTPEAADATPQTTTADAEGRFRFEADRAGPYRVRIDVGDGHIAEARVTVMAAPDAAEAAQPTVAAGAPVASATPVPPSTNAGLTEAQLEALVARAVARELRPLAERIEAADARLRWSDIAGGLGMIIGLFGLLAYARSRRWIGPRP